MTDCARPNCTRIGRPYAQGLCKPHYAIWRQSNRPVPTDIVCAHIDKLREFDIGLSRLSQLSGISLKTLREIDHKGRRFVVSKTAQGILSVTVPGDYISAAVLALRNAVLPDATRVPAIGTTRRMQALAVIGYHNTLLAEYISYAGDDITGLLFGRRTQCNAKTARKVDEVFQKLQLTPAPDTMAARRAKGRALKRGWAPPLAWDIEPSYTDEDGNKVRCRHYIDDPDAKPASPKEKWYRPSRERKKNENQRNRREIPNFVDVVNDHRSIGRSDKDIAERLGLTIDAFYQRLQRAKLKRKTAS